MSLATEHGSVFTLLERGITEGDRVWDDNCINTEGNRSVSIRCALPRLCG